MPLYAAIDCGTNTFRLLISDGTNDLVRATEEVGLGDGFSEGKKEILKSSLLAARAALQKFKQELIRHEVPAEQVRITGTSAPRVADNGSVFAEIVRQVTGQKLELIQGVREAQLGFHGASRAVVELAPDSPAPFMTVDIGGGSTELCIGGPKGLEERVSTEVGSNWITGRFKALAEKNAPGIDPSDTATVVALSPGILDELRQEVREQIAEQLTAANRERAKLGKPPLDLAAVNTLIGVGGTAETLAAVVNRQPFDAQPVWMPTDGIVGTADELYEATVARRCEMGVATTKRAKKIPAGALVLGEVFSLLGDRLPSRMLISPYDLRDGLVAELASAERSKAASLPSIPGVGVPLPTDRRAIVVRRSPGTGMRP